MRKTFQALAILALFAAIAVPAHAGTIYLTAADLIGYVDVQGLPADVASQIGQMNALIGLYNAGGVVGGANVPAPPLPLITDGIRIDGAGPFDIDTPYLYVLAKFGNYDALYYLNGQVGQLAEADLYNPVGYGLSHITLFNGGQSTTIPEPATVILVGASLLGLLGFRKFWK